MDKDSPTTILSKIEPSDWESHWKMHKEDLNLLVLDYFIYEGLINLAQTFATEKNLEYLPDHFLLKRSELRSLFLEGEIDAAMQKLNEMDSNFVDTNLFLYYFLMEHKALEMMHSAYENNFEEEIDNILEYLQKEIQCIVEENNELLPYLEDLIGHFIFNNINIGEKRKEIANYVNMKLMEERSESCRLKDLVREVVNGESTIGERYVFPTFESYFN